MKKTIRRMVSILLSLIIVASIFAIVPIEVGAAGNSFSGATTYYLGNTANGNITENNKNDFYKFTLTSSGKISLYVNAYFKFSGYYIYDSNYNKVWESYIGNNYWNSSIQMYTNTFDVDLISGTYYLLINGDMNPYYYTGNYNFKINFSSAGESFSGSDNSFSNAKSISLNTRYCGQIAENDKNDFYKFKLTSSSKISLYVNAYFKFSGYYIFDSSYNKVWESYIGNNYWNSSTRVFTNTFDVNLKSGTYYLLINGDMNPYYYTGNYNFRISTPQPAKPSAATISVANGINGLDVAWGKVANAKSYVVYYKTASSNWLSFSTTSTKATIANISSGKLYYVQVQSIGADGVKGNYSKVKSMTYLARTNITSLTYNGNNNLKYNSVSGANKYQIARLKSGDKSYTYFYSTTPTFTEKNAVGGVAYTYQVRAMYQTANNGTAYGAWSASKSVPTLVAPTVTLANKSNGIRVTWNSIRGAIRYIVYYKKSTDKNWSSAVTTNLYYPILNTTRGATYYVQVRPVGSTVSTPYSSVKSIVFK